MCVIVPRLLEFDWKIGADPAEMIYDDLWLTTTVSEARQVLVTTPLDYVSSLLPPFLWLVTLDTIKNMVRRQPPMSGHDIVAVRGRAPSILTKRRVELKRIAAMGTSRSKHVNRIGMLWGVGVIVLHFLAERPLRHTTHSTMLLDRLCKLRLNAWLARRYPCSVVMVDCHQNQFKGESDVLGSYLTAYDRATLTKVIFSHCSALELPSVLTEFAQLRSFVTFNTTTSSWPRSAALTSAGTPLVVALDMVDTNMSALPDGIYHDDLPQGLNFLLYRSNLSSLPHDIGDVWGSHNWISMWLEHTNLKEVPTSFSNLKIQKLALMSNRQLTNLHEYVFQRQAFSWLRLSRNPRLSQLPSSLGDTSRLSHLLCEDTNVTTLPDQVLAWLSTDEESGTTASVVSFQGSPVCKLGLFPTLVMCGEVSDAVKDEFRCTRSNRSPATHSMRMPLNNERARS